MLNLFRSTLIVVRPVAAKLRLLQLLQIKRNYHQLIIMSTGPVSKKRHVQIATHNGCFHADEVIAIAMLRLLPEYQDAEVIRTRDYSRLDNADVVIDVGHKYDPSNLRFDHHQPDFVDTMQTLCAEKPWNVVLSSCGLIYHHFGRRVLRQLAGSIELTEEKLEKLWDLVYEQFLIEIDAIDNGIEACEAKAKHVYKIQTGISSRIAQLNPNWKQDSSEDAQYKRFQQALEVARTEFVACVQRQLNEWLPAYDVMSKVFAERFDVDSSGQIIQFPEGIPPSFVHALYEIEREQDLEGEIKYYVFSDVSPNSYRVRAMNKAGKFDLRMPLPEAWRGLRDQDLNDLVGLDNCVFVHKNGFIGGATTMESAVEMARRSLRIHAEIEANNKSEELESTVSAGNTENGVDQKDGDAKDVAEEEQPSQKVAKEI